MTCKFFTVTIQHEVIFVDHQIIFLIFKDNITCQLHAFAIISPFDFRFVFDLIQRNWFGIQSKQRTTKKQRCYKSRKPFVHNSKMFN